MPDDEVDDTPQPAALQKNVVIAVLATLVVALSVAVALLVALDDDPAKEDGELATTWVPDGGWDVGKGPGSVRPGRYNITGVAPWERFYTKGCRWQVAPSRQAFRTEEDAWRVPDTVYVSIALHDGNYFKTEGCGLWKPAR